MDKNEFPPLPYETNPPPEGSELTEEVVSSFNTACEKYRLNPPPTPQERKIAGEFLHSKLEHFENPEKLRLYEEGKVPTFESIGKAIEQTRLLLAEARDEEAERLSKLLEIRKKEIKTWCRKYVQTLIRFQKVKNRMGSMDEWKFEDEMQKVDTDRRRNHNALLESLSTLESVLAQSYDYLGESRPAMWSPGQNAPRGFADEQALTFSTQALSNRDLIRDWSIVADCVEEIRDIASEPKAA